MANEMTKQQQVGPDAPQSLAKADGGTQTFEDWSKGATTDRLDEVHRPDREGQLQEARGKEGQRDTTQDQDRTNDRPQSVDQQRQAGQMARVNAKIKEVAERIRGGEPKREDPMKAKVQALAERFNDRGRGRADEGRGR